AEQIINDYCAGLYGPAAEEMAEFFLAMERAFADSDAHEMSKFQYVDDVFTADELADANAHLQRAEELAGGVEAERIALVRMAFDHTWDLRALLAEEGTVQERLAVAERMTERLARAREAGAINKGARRKMAGLLEKARLEASIEATQARDWNVPAETPLDLTVATILRDEPTADERAALKFARNQARTVIELRSADLPSAADVDVVWYHATREDLPEWLQEDEARDALLELVRAGVGLVGLCLASAGDVFPQDAQKGAAKQLVLPRRFQSGRCHGESLCPIGRAGL
ncbi:MAG: hypothetical protein U9Q79_00680, partial [Candidatus Hydrogenedentes bacterium]|nr:hypothetical protein [Candidatus Hydrogenedentota bacterium]